MSDDGLSIVGFGVNIAQKRSEAWVVHLSANIADGDLNHDSMVDVRDTLLAQQILNGEVSPSIHQLQHGDVGPVISGTSAPDGNFDIADLLVIWRKVIAAIN